MLIEVCCVFNKSVGQSLRLLRVRQNPESKLLKIVGQNFCKWMFYHSCLWPRQQGHSTDTITVLLHFLYFALVVIGRLFWQSILPHVFHTS